MSNPALYRRACDGVRAPINLDSCMQFPLYWPRTRTSLTFYWTDEGRCWLKDVTPDESSKLVLNHRNLREVSQVTVLEAYLASNIRPIPPEVIGPPPECASTPEDVCESSAPTTSTPKPDDVGQSPPPTTSKPEDIGQSPPPTTATPKPEEEGVGAKTSATKRKRTRQRKPKPPRPTTLQELAAAIRRDHPRQRNVPKFLELIADRDEVGFDEIADVAHGARVEDNAVEKTVIKAKRLIAKARLPIILTTSERRVFKGQASG
jgi:hypothetical protein